MNRSLLLTIEWVTDTLLVLAAVYCIAQIVLKVRTIRMNSVRTQFLVLQAMSFLLKGVCLSCYTIDPKLRGSYVIYCIFDVGFLCLYMSVLSLGMFFVQLAADVSPERVPIWNRRRNVALVAVFAFFLAVDMAKLLLLSTDEGWWDIPRVGVHCVASACLLWYGARRRLSVTLRISSTAGRGGEMLLRIRKIAVLGIIYIFVRVIVITVFFMNSLIERPEYSYPIFLVMDCVLPCVLVALFVARLGGNKVQSATQDMFRQLLGERIDGGNAGLSS